MCAPDERTAQARGARVGHGSRPLRYVVKVETGLDISPAQSADEIAQAGSRSLTTLLEPAC